MTNGLYVNFMNLNEESTEKIERERLCLWVV